MLKDNNEKHYFIKTILNLILLAVLLVAGPPHIASSKEPDQEKKEQTVIMPNPSSFVKENLEKARENLKKLTREYEASCGSLLLNYIEKGGNPKDIAGRLPQPKTLRFHVSYPEERPPEIAGDALRALRDPRNKIVLQGALLPSAYGGYVASDGTTSAMLNIKNVISPADPGYSPKISYTILYDTFSYVSTLCGALIRNGESGELNLFALPEDIRERIGVRFSGSDGVDVLKNGSVKFFTPGTKKVTMYGSGGLEGVRPELCEGRQVWTDYKAAHNDITRTMTFKAIKFLAFGIPGLDFTDEGARAPFVDYFVPLKQVHKGVTASTKSMSTSAREPFVLEIMSDPYAISRFTPKVIVDAGDEGKRSFEISRHTSEFPVSVKTEVKEAGPILPAGEGGLAYAGGTGSSVIVWQLGKLETYERTVKHRLTVNSIEVLLDPEMLDGQLAQGGSYNVKLLVAGDADMAGNYTLSWDAQGPAKWAEQTTFFKKEGSLWVAENTLTTDASQNWKDAIGKEIQFSATAAYMPVAGRNEAQRALGRMAMGLSQPSSERAFSLRGNARLAVPAAEKLKLLVKHGNEKPEEASEVDLFYPNNRAHDVRLIPHLVLKDNEEPVMVGNLKAPVQVEFTSTNPNAATVMTGGRITSNARDSVETEITARLNGYSAIYDPKEEHRMLEIKGDTLTSRTVFVNVNRVLLTASTGRDGKPFYKLAVSGAGDMGKYNAVWNAAGFLGSSKTATRFEKEGDAYVTSLSTGSKVESILIVKGNTVLAELGTGSMLAQARIALLPANPPATTVKKASGDDPDGFTSLAECVSTVARWVDMWGFDTQGTPENYCRQRMQQRAWQRQTQNTYIQELNQKGLELVVFSDTMKVGAAVTGLAREFWDKTSCRWSIQSDSKLSLDKDMTPLQMSSESLGGCFNVVKGIEDNFDPKAVINVELVLDTVMPNYPLFIDPQKYVGSADEFRR